MEVRWSRVSRRLAMNQHVPCRCALLLTWIWLVEDTAPKGRDKEEKYRG
jgi:hypothetical protein